MDNVDRWTVSIDELWQSIDPAPHDGLTQGTPSRNGVAVGRRLASFHLRPRWCIVTAYTTETMRHPAQIRLDTSSDVPAYKQVADQLRMLIVEKVPSAGESLPPVRRLALELGVHFNTVAEAYRVLAQEGFLEITHGHGARIVDRVPPRRAAPESLENFRQRLRELVAAVRARGLSTRQIVAELRLVKEGLEKS
jgi:GntR family transcriptional regulator